MQCGFVQIRPRIDKFLICEKHLFFAFLRTATCARNGQELVIEKILSHQSTRAFALSILKKLTSDNCDVVKLIAVDSLTSQQQRRYFDVILSHLEALCKLILCFFISFYSRYHLMLQLDSKIFLITLFVNHQLRNSIVSIPHLCFYHYIVFFILHVRGLSKKYPTFIVRA